MTKRWKVLTVSSFFLAVFTLGVGFFQFFCRGGGAEWLTAAGGFGLIWFAAVQLQLEGKREQERQKAAVAKLKPVARLARRSCEQAVIASNGKALNQWLAEWFAPKGTDRQHPLDVLESRMRETVTLAAEASGTEMVAADSAFDAFISAADIINDMSKTLLGTQEDRILQENSPRGREAANHLRKAARELEVLAPRGSDEPQLPMQARFMHER